MADILTTIQKLRTKGTQINDNLGSFMTTNKEFKTKLLENLTKIQEALAKLNFQEFGTNKQALLQANKELEDTKIQLQEKQQQLAETTKLLEESRKETETANRTLQESSSQIQELDKKNREAIEEMQKQHQLAVEEAKALSGSEQQALRQQLEQEKQTLQTQFDEQRAVLEEERNKAILAAQEASQKMSQIETSQTEIQNGLNDIDALLDKQLEMINNVVNSDPSVGDLNNLVDVIQANLVAGINMLSQTQQASTAQPSTIKRGFDLPQTLDEFRQFGNQQAKQDFYKVSQNDGNSLNLLIKQGEQTGDMSAAEELYKDLLRRYNERYARVKGGRRKTKKRNMYKRKRAETLKTSNKRMRQQKGGYTYGKEDMSLNKSSSLVSVGSDKPKPSSYLRKSYRTRKARGIRRQTKKRRL